MVAFDLKTPRRDYPGAFIRTGYYPKEQPSDPQQIGWQIYAADGEPLGTVTVNLWNPPNFPAPGCVWIKVTDGFEGWLESLVAAGLVEPTGVEASAGKVPRYAAECRVLRPELLEVV